MSEYRLLTIWRIEAPLPEVYAAIHNTPRWPHWWPGVEKVEQISAGKADGIHSVWRYVWQGQLPYQVMFEACPTRIEAQRLIEGSTRGDLEGTGRWQFSRRGPISTVSCYWHVHSTRWWMNLLAPLARPLFIHNHAHIMTQGGQALARLLQAPLISQENLDLMRPETAKKIPRAHAPALWLIILVAGIAAGTLATLAQLALWWLADIPLIPTLLRDAHLTAAILMGHDVLPPSSANMGQVLLLASLIHCVISIVYAIPAALLLRWERSRGSTLLIGALYGLGIYGINLHGFTLLFPWFAVTRDGITLAAHIVFGISLTVICKALHRGPLASLVLR